MNNISKGKNRLTLIIFSCLFFISLITIVVFSNIRSFANKYQPLNLTQKQMIILSNYVYLDDGYETISIKDQLDSYKTNDVYDKSLINLPASGIKDSQMIEMLNEIEKDDILIDLVAVDAINTDIRAVCFVPKDQVNVDGAEAVVVFLGTKALDEAWLDCLEGAYYEDTRLQLEAGAFIDKINEKYTVTNVTGHSKGGNLAQYVTITHGENIRNCVSFNGQGFSELFLNKYQAEIETQANKITSIVSYKEPVNTFLNPIATKELIIKTDSSVDILSSHVSSYLYNKTFFDTNGNYVDTCFTEQTSTIKNFNKLCDSIANNLDKNYIKAVSEKVAPTLGTMIPMLQNAMAREDVSILKGFYQEVVNHIKNSKEQTLSSEDIENLNEIAYN